MMHRAKIRFNPLPAPSAVRRLLTAMAAILILSALAATGAQAKTDTIDLRAFAAPEGAIKAVVPADRVVWLNLVAAKPSHEAVEISLTEFRDDQGNTVPVYFMPEAGTNQKRNTKITLPLDRDRLTLRLDASALMPGRAYTGELWVREPGEPLRQFPVRLETGDIKVFQGTSSTAAGLDVTVPANGTTTVSIETAPLGVYGETADFRLSSFMGQESGATAQVYFVEADGSRKTVAKDVPLDKGAIPMVLDATGLASGEVYVGTLITEIEGRYLAPFTLKMNRRIIPQNAVIAVDKPIPTKLTCYYECRPPAIDVVLQEKSGKRPLIGISVEADTPSGESNLNPVTDLLVTLNPPQKDGHKPENLWQLDPDNAVALKQRSLSSGAQAIMRVAFRKELPPGKYQTVLKVRSLNAKPDNLAKLPISVEIQYPWWYALIVLILAVLVSYLAAKGIRTKMRRLSLTAKVGKLKNAYWLQRDRSGALPVVRVKAVLSRVQKALANEKGIIPWFSVPGTLEGQVEAVEKRFPYLFRLYACRTYWEQSNEEPMVVRRAQKVLRGIIRAFADCSLDEDLSEGIKEQLATLEKWENEAELQGLYWLDLLKDIRQLQHKMQGQLRCFESPDLDPLQKALDRLLFPVARLKKAMNLLDGLKNNLSAKNGEETGEALTWASRVLHDFYRESAKPLHDLLVAAGEALGNVENKGTAELAEKLKRLRQGMETGKWVESLHTPAEVARKLDAVTAPYPQALKRKKQEIGTLLREVATDDPIRIEEDLAAAFSALETIKSSDREIVRSLLLALKPHIQPVDLPEAIERERTYATLKLIWTQRNDQEMLKALIGLKKQNRTLEELFRKVDTWAWQRLRDKGVHMELRVSEGEVETYQLFDLEIQPKIEKLRGNYLFKHGLLYEWTIDFGNKAPLTPKTREPKVTQFIPVAGKEITVSVRIRFEDTGDYFDMDNFKFSSKPSGEFGFIKAFQSVEVMALVLALLAAVATGMNSAYYTAALTGSAESYVALFLWGIGVDQVKNLLQNLKGYMGSDA